MWFGILGVTEVRADDGTPVAVGGPRPRALLALLLLETGRLVGTSELIDDLYGENPPKDAGNALQAQVSRLRRRLGTDLIEFHPGGYRLKVDPDQVDVHRFTRLARAGRQALETGEHRKAAALLAEGLAYWRGEPELPETPAARLSELRLSAVEDRAEAELAAGLRGESRELVTELQVLVAENPLRERLHGLLMRALRASGRQAEALTAFEDARRTLADELGADPSPELAETHLAILTGEPIRAAAVPAQLTKFFGRDHELKRVRELLGTARLVTVTGPGGMGKTRLAIQASTAADASEVCFVDLAPVTGGAEVPQAVLSALGLREAGLLGSPGQRTDLVDRLAAVLRDRPILLIFDNCEHVIAETAELVHRLLSSCPSVRVLATSREPLGITGEALCPLPPLAEDVAMRLFADRAEAVAPGFAMEDAVRRICRALDGLPLAIELAAARLRSLTPAQLEARLDDRFRLLSRGSRTAAPRHQTLRAVVSWSWDLLDPREQRLLRRLSVFAGGATATAAAAVLSEVDAEDLLDALADKSLIEASAGRYRMLETIRQFSAELLAETGEQERFARAHAEYFLDLARTADPHLRRAEQSTWLARLTAEHANLHAALRWAVGADPRLALRLIGALTLYWRLRGVRSEISPLAGQLITGLEPEQGLEEEYVLAVLNALPPPEDALERAKAIMRTRNLPLRQPYLVVAWSLFAGPPDPDVPLIPLHDQLATARDPWMRALVHFSFSYLRIFEGDLAAAETEFAESLAWFRSVGDRWGIAQVLDGLAQLAGRQGDWKRALALTEEAIGEMTQLGAVEEIAELSCRRASLLMHGGELDAAEIGYQRVEELANRIGVPATLMMVHHGYGQLAERRGDRAEARHRFRQALGASGPDWQSLGARCEVLISLALLDEDGERAAYLLGVTTAAGTMALAPVIANEVRRLAGDAVYDAAFGRGASMSREEAVSFVATT
ncbi:MAG TPA: BTAD domain-containing putative transcriptional regulator [Amycolatopsis sp.]|uniref:BTAD domain-containing putative transcriptional regulator n=1 Tax=Amycolatopsis sp. TaxID=37632 RepID=UPI002B4A3428|nr:BTAD domain-containing putative transcriptional regulator [Amycolatopsis sp.]HKS47282.1 BTAD domain-containing putative transcriptional regulator [Amycolatopsis sp.]